MGFTPAQAQGTAINTVLEGGAATNRQIIQINNTIAVASVAAKAGYGTFDVVSGIFLNVVPGAAIAGGGATATATVPVIGQLAGPPAVVFGSAEIGLGLYKITAGWIDIAEAIKGQGYDWKPFALLPTPPQYTPVVSQSEKHCP